MKRITPSLTAAQAAWNLELSKSQSRRTLLEIILKCDGNIPNWKEIKSIVEEAIKEVDYGD